MLVLKEELGLPAAQASQHGLPIGGQFLWLGECGGDDQQDAGCGREMRKDDDDLYGTMEEDKAR